MNKIGLDRNMILVGDVGGTKTRLALYQEENNHMIGQEMATFVSRDFTGLEEVVMSFLGERKVVVQTACFGVPGPVVNGEAQTTNLPWTLKEVNVAKITKIKKVKLVNDLVATTAAVPYLSSEDLFVLYKGKGPENKESPRGVLAPGTGLGQAFLYFCGGQYHVHASEGGHIDFAPNSDVEFELLQFLKTKYDHVSYERILCGPGLVNIYSFLKQTGQAPEPPALANRLQQEDPAAVISATGQAGEFEICVKALDIFASVLGARAGSLVLTLLATGGIYLGGGIPPKIMKKLSDGTTVDAYLNKGRLSNLVKSTSMYIIKDDHAALLGAAHLASHL